MKKWFTGFSMCWGMFCAIPNPVRRWEQGCYRQMLLCLPFIGVFMGALWALFGKLLGCFPIPQPIFALCMAAFMWCVTGFIHLDGFMDCSDAVLSRRDLERRREILKDSHVGSFAVICLTLLALFQYSVWRSGIAAEKLWALPLICAAVRCVSASAVLGLAPLESSGYRTMEHSHGAAAAAWIMAAVCVGLGFLLPERGFLCVPVAVASAGLTVLLLRRNLGGMCGDISGAAITLGEACGCAALLL